ncbi:MAG: UDP-N-acetylmuramoyl-L-alanyl-D-glutamate--2,6-diaminopimelate ligase [Crocinitomicaceae bacterium]|nr:UDP-N-acetylmuramoyl-L-alanyl-D-glutamate--2,6-diaminopimelate ligase [Crocinitomicaceae bacterium]
MRLLKDILYRARIIEVTGSVNVPIESVTMDSRAVNPFSLFVAVKGVQTDGHKYIQNAIASGASAIVCERIPEIVSENITYITVNNSSEALGFIASNFFDNPSEKIKVIAVTGTNGKTTTATLLYQLAIDLGKKAGLLSTVVNKINREEVASTHTTPDAVSLNSMLADMVDAGCELCFMEASSHALHQNRVAGIKFTGAIFTNITHDHLDYHKTFNEYIKAKKLLFDSLPSSAFAIINHDDRNGEIMVQNCRAKVKLFALQSMADYKAKVLENGFTGLHLLIDNQDVYTRLIGGFNAYNILGVYAAAMELGMDKTEVLTRLSTLEAPDGRFQHITTSQHITAVVDYAHTPDALQNVLRTISEIRTGNEKVITLVGCGGDRDREKRPEMARIAAEMSDRVVLTSDNPRNEDPESIISEMKKGLNPVLTKKTLAVTDRREAIKIACTLASAGDIILLAGKGHEKYQEVKGRKMPFDDYEVAAETLKILDK